MNKAIKAALLSAFIFPGSGQLYLKRYWRGLLIMMLIVVGLSVIIMRATIAVLDTLKVIQGNGQPIDMEKISRLVETSSANIFADNSIILVFLAACWIFSVVDAYRIGRKSLYNEGDGHKTEN